MTEQPAASPVTHLHPDCTCTHLPGAPACMASEHPTTTTGRVTDKYGGMLAAGTSYGFVTVGGQAIPIAEARKLPALITRACDDAEAWQAVQAANQAAHDKRLAASEPDRA